MNENTQDMYYTRNGKHEGFEYNDEDPKVLAAYKAGFRDAEEREKRRQAQRYDIEQCGAGIAGYPYSPKPEPTENELRGSAISTALDLAYRRIAAGSTHNTHAQQIVDDAALFLDFLRPAVTVQDMPGMTHDEFALRD